MSKRKQHVLNAHPFNGLCNNCQNDLMTKDLDFDGRPMHNHPFFGILCTDCHEGIAAKEEDQENGGIFI